MAFDADEQPLRLRPQARGGDEARHQERCPGDVRRRHRWKADQPLQQFFDTDGYLYVACYELSQVLRLAPDGTVARLIADEEAHLFCHPTNLALRGYVLFTNLG